MFRPYDIIVVPAHLKDIKTANSRNEIIIWYEIFFLDIAC